MNLKSGTLRNYLDNITSKLINDHKVPIEEIIKLKQHFVGVKNGFQSLKNHLLNCKDFLDDTNDQDRSIQEKTSYYFYSDLFKFY
ncbi:hypothetical protein BOFE_00930 [Candidatus Borrelia fainii]|uniref:Uncharacterized protein n=1 Tax=Candidatus Borrelia fainii TaxID=2518322 RepID=A0ABM8DJ56_9SPIR|nr:hypothetical protein BOFE_00930 [Candidatus Borrelia fainii]